MKYCTWNGMHSAVVAGLLAIAVAALGGCAAAQRVVQAPDVRLASLTLLEAGAETQRFRAGLVVRNPNPTPMTIEQLSFSVRLGGSGTMSGRALEPFTLLPSDSHTLELDVQSDLLSSLSRLRALLQGPNDTLSYDLDGFVTLSRGLQRTQAIGHRGDVPVSMRGSLR